MITDNLRTVIHNTVMETRREVTLVVMHPATWDKIMEENLVGNISYINFDPQGQKFMGIKVLRSFDIEEFSFECYN